MSQKALENISNEVIRKNSLIKLWKTDKPESKKEIAYWMIQLLSDMQPKMFPSTPRGIQELNELKDYGQKRKILENTDFWKQPDIESYLKQRSLVKAMNRSNCYWLGEILDWLPEEDTASRGRITNLLNDYKQRGLYIGAEEKKKKPVEVGWDD